MSLKSKLIEWLGAYTYEEYKEIESSRDIYRDKYINSLAELSSLKNTRSLLATISDKLDKEKELNKVYSDQIENLKNKLNGK